MASNKVGDFFAILDFGHTLFGLPFAYLGAFLAAGGWPTANQLLWITVAMVSARTAAMCLNRLIDRHFDRLNPRTAHWVMAQERLPVRLIWMLVPVLFLVLFYAAAQLNPLCFKLAPLAVLVLWGYSYTKRFTWWCHLFLGMAIGIGPIGAWFAITGSFDWQPFLLGAAVACWIAGFDIMYACQDIEFDRKQGLYSIPARFGEKKALHFSVVLHILTVLFLLVTGIILNLGGYYYGGIVLAATVLFYEHKVVQPGNLSKIDLVFLHINRYVGLIIMLFTLLDILR